MTIKNLIKNAMMLVILLASSISFAQQPGMQKRTPEERAQRQTQWMQKNLALTDDQTKSVYNIILSAAQQLDNARNAAPGSDKRAQVQDINANRDAALKGALTGDQYQKYQQHMQEMQDKRRNAGGRQGQGAPQGDMRGGE